MAFASLDSPVRVALPSKEGDTVSEMVGAAVGETVSLRDEDDEDGADSFTAKSASSGLGSAYLILTSATRHELEAQLNFVKVVAPTQPR